MGQEYSVTCPVCKKKDSVYKDVFEAECSSYKDFSKWIKNPPPFHEYLGLDCLKYLYSDGAFYRKDKNIVNWLFYSCEDCICIGDKERAEKFQEYDKEGVKIWMSQLP